jgi:hypothetical protein
LGLTGNSYPCFSVLKSACKTLVLWAKATDFIYQKQEGTVLTKTLNIKLIVSTYLPLLQKI